MSIDDKQFHRIILKYRLECKLEENLCLFICIFKVGSNETVELMLNFDRKIGKRFAINIWLLKNF